MKKIIASILSIMIMSSSLFSTLSVSAEQYNDILFERNTYSTSIQPYGKDKPSSDAVWDLSAHNYNGLIMSFSVGIYANYWFTNTTSINVYVGGSSMKDYLTNVNPNITKQVKITIYKNNLDTIVGEAILNNHSSYLNSFSKTVLNLDPNAKYLVKITKTNDTIPLTDLTLSVKSVS